MPCNRISNPLRYPGSKASLTDYIAAILEENLLSGCTIYEPYAGSATISLEMVVRGYASSAVIVERDPLVYSFWKTVFGCTTELCEEIEKVDVSLKTWELFQKYRVVQDPTAFSIIELGLAGLFFNRTNFSGIIGAGPIGGLSQSSTYSIDCRFNKNKLIKQIQALSKLKDRVNVIFGDAIQYLSTHENTIGNGFSFVYIDPPYYSQGKKLYRYHYNDEMHKILAEYILLKDFPWLISYDDHPKIRKLYSNKSYQQIYLDYSVKTSRKGSELLISNLIIPPLSQQKTYHSNEVG